MSHLKMSNSKLFPSALRSNSLKTSTERIDLQIESVSQVAVLRCQLILIKEASTLGGMQQKTLQSGVKSDDLIGGFSRSEIAYFSRRK